MKTHTCIPRQTRILYFNSTRFPKLKQTAFLYVRFSTSRTFRRPLADRNKHDRSGRQYCENVGLSIYRFGSTLFVLMMLCTPYFGRRYEGKRSPDQFLVLEGLQDTLLDILHGILSLSLSLSLFLCIYA